MELGYFVILAFLVFVSYKLFDRYIHEPAQFHLVQLQTILAHLQKEVLKSNLSNDEGVILNLLLEDKMKKEERKMHKQNQIRANQQKKEAEELQKLIFEEEMVKFNYLFAETKKREEAQKVVETEMLLAEEQRKLEEIENAKKAHDLELQNLAKNLGELGEARMKKQALLYKKIIE